MKSSVLQNQKGLTLIELAIVTVIAAVLLAAIVPNLIGKTSGASALAKFKAATAIKDCGQKIHAELGLGTDILTNSAYVSGNDLLDVCVSGSTVTVASVQARMDLANSSNVREQITVVTEPTSGTKGVYNKENSVLTLDATQETDFIRIQFTNVASDEVKELEVKQDGSTSFDPDTANSDGKVLYNAASSGTHTLTIRLPFKI